MKYSILIITDDLKYACGVTTFLYNFLLGMRDNKEFDMHVICSGGDSIEKFKELGIKLIVRESFKYELKSKLNFFKSIVFLAFYIRKNKIKVIHSQNHYVANIAYLISVFFKIKTIQSHHNLFTKVGRLKQFKASKHIAVSERIRDYIVRNNFVKDSNVFLVRYGIKYQNEVLQKDDNRINVLAISRFIPEKGMDTFIKAVALLPVRYQKDVDFYLAGEGTEKNYLIGLMKSLNSTIKFLGKAKNPLSLFYKNHIFVMTTNWECEGYPLTLIEAALTKNFIITSNFKGVEEVFLDNKDGFTFRHSNAIDLAEKLKNAIDNYYYLTELIMNYHLKVRRLFNHEKMVNKIIEIYRTSLN